MRKPTLIVCLFAALAFLSPRLAEACGCFAAPNPAIPVVQAGEKILFAQDGTKVTAHIQIQYEGEAEEFGWLIPVPAVPDVRLSAEEVFSQLEANTNPQFLYTVGPGFCDQGGGAFGCSDDEVALAAEIDPGAQQPPSGPDDVVVVQSTAGPFEFAVVRADTKTPMVEWLQTNGYVVPAGGEDLLDPYIGSDAYFLALKLRSGQSVGDLQPIVIEYDADMPMIPLILTRLGANPDMGVLVWILGDARAVSTNYRHVQINEEYIDWPNGADNYADVVARAVDEAEDGQAFVTEFAGASDIMVGRLDPPGRFGRRDVFEQTTDAIEYVRLLVANDFPMDALRPVFERVFPVAPEATRNGITTDDYYADLASSLAAFDPMPAAFMPVELTAEIWERVVVPTLAAGALFRQHPYMTRLYTAISPEEMTADPVFSFNPDLADVSNTHNATMLEQCDPENDKVPWQLTLDDGRQYYVADPSDWSTRSTGGAPRTTVIERMSLEGEPAVEVDNRENLRNLSGVPDAGGCSSTGRSRWSALFNWALIFGSVLFMRRRLRRRVRG